MEVVSVKVDKETREKMCRLSHVNWSETIRRAIEVTIYTEEMKDRNVDPKDIREGMIIATSVRRPSKGWNSTKEIRKWRDLRK
jgi:hypothetical protein